jgi:hypothetical protein
MEALTNTIKKNSTVAVIIAIPKGKWKRLQIKIWHYPRQQGWFSA